MKRIPEVLVVVAVISGVGYILWQNSIWIVVLIGALLASIILFLLDQEHKAKS